MHAYRSKSDREKNFTNSHGNMNTTKIH